jgi:hemolysin activation/secretion protein
MRAGACVWLAAACAVLGGSRGAQAAGPGFPIREVQIRGDAAVLAREGLLEPWKAELTGRTLSPEEVHGKARQLRDQLRERGYFLASVRTPPADYSAGVVPIEVDAGRFGTLAISGPGGAPFDGRWFDEEQLRYRLSGMAEGLFFRESDFYRHVLGVNTHPDLVLDPVLTVRKENEGGLVRRYADIRAEVTEALPLHAILTVDNTGTEATGEWRASALVQYLNLTRHDDILSVWLGPVSEESGSSHSAAASYLRPNRIGRGGGTLLYGGYSDVEAQEVADVFAFRGEGWFVGLREDWRLAANEVREVVLSLGASWRSQEETLSVEQDEFEGDTRTVSVLPISVGLQVNPMRMDAWNGRTFLDAEIVCGPGGLTGSEDDIEEFKPGAEATYVVGRLRLARLQPLGSAPRERTGELWMLFGRAELQGANGALLGAEQLALGGMETVRGFAERAVMGDQGGDATLELRTPLSGSFLHAQGVLFADAGHAISEGEDDRDAITLAGAGAGIRLAMGPYSQVRLDYGVPVSGKDEVEEETGTTVDSGRLHLRATIQF